MPRRFAASTLDTFPTLVDADNVLGQTFGFKAIPNGVFVDPEGKVEGVVAGGFDIREPATARLVESWLETSNAPGRVSGADLRWSDEALQLFREAGAAVRSGDREVAVRLLKQAFPLEPDNFIIRKQLWAIEHPDRFYQGEVDYGWQHQQLDAGR